MSASVDLTEFRAAYLVEAGELLVVASSALLRVESALRNGEPHGREVRELFRVMHTLKGLSAMVGIEPVVAISHRMEASLRTAGRSGGRLTAAAVDALLEGVKAAEQRVRALADGQPILDPPQALLDSLDALETALTEEHVITAGDLDLESGIVEKLTAEDRQLLAQGTAQGRRALRADFVPSRERTEAGINITTVRQRMSTLAEIVKVIPVSVPVGEQAQGGLMFTLLLLTNADDAAIAEAAAVEPGSVREFVRPSLARAEETQEPSEDYGADEDVRRTGVVRVDVARLDDTMEGLSSLVVTSFRLRRALEALAQRGADVRELSEILRENGRQLRDLRGTILRVRMIRVSEAFERIPLLVRGVARATGKVVALHLDAGRAELDKAVADKIFPVLVHLVRNAVDHAFETPELRKQAGKPEEGQLSITCFERSNTQLEITISDDGRGVDRAQVARRAGRPVPTTDAALLDLMCLPGLSTRDEATTTSGRGMGMDIVKRVVETLGGDLSMRTSPGKGTRFVLHVPLTIAIVDAFGFECAQRRFVVPVSMVEEILEVTPSELIHAPARSARQLRAPRMIERRGETVAYLELEVVLGLAPRIEGSRKAFLVRRKQEPIAFAIDRVLGQYDVVVRPLEDPLVRVPGVVGATDLGDGKPTLVLDLAALGPVAGSYLPLEVAS